MRDGNENAFLGFYLPCVRKTLIDYPLLLGAE